MGILLALLLSLPAQAGRESDDFSMAFESWGSNREIGGKHTGEWTNWLTICDPVRMETLQHGGLSQEPPVLASTIDEKWDQTDDWLQDVSENTCHGDLRSMADNARAEFKRMREDVMPHIRAESCEREAISAQERLTAIREGSTKIASYEKTLQANLAKMDDRLRELGPKVKYWKPKKDEKETDKAMLCDLWSELYLWVARVKLNSVSCEMYFAKLRMAQVANRMERGIASVAPCVPTNAANQKKKNELEQEYLDELNGHEGRPGAFSGESDITGVD